MNLFKISILFVLLAICVVSFQHASAEVWIPDNEFGGYFDSNGIYTVIGAVKNTVNVAIVPTITLNIKDSEKMISNSYALSIVDTYKDIPFEIKLTQMENKNAIF